MEDETKPAEAPVEWPLVHRLSAPVEIGGETYDTLTLRAPTVADCLAAGLLDGSMSGSRLIDLIASLSGVAQPIVKRLPIADILPLIGTLNRFFGQAAR